MAKRSMEDQLSGVVKHITSIMDGRIAELKVVGKEDLDAALSVAKEQFKDNPNLDSALDMIKKRGVKI